MEQASEDVCIFAPAIASIQEVVFVLNPIYNNMVDDAFEVILRSGFNILMHKCIMIPVDTIADLFEKKFNTGVNE